MQRTIFCIQSAWSDEWRSQSAKNKDVNSIAPPNQFEQQTRIIATFHRLSLRTLHSFGIARDYREPIVVKWNTVLVSSCILIGASYHMLSVIQDSPNGRRCQCFNRDIITTALVFDKEMSKLSSNIPDAYNEKPAGVICWHCKRSRHYCEEITYYFRTKWRFIPIH